MYKLKTYIITILFSIPLLSTAQSLITVKQDGTGDYTTIQEGVDAASDGDTVLVWPGTYFENVKLDNKNIILGSLVLTTGNQAYTHQTIVNGYQNGSCLEIRNCISKCEIHGFELTNGSGTSHGFISGGGVFIKKSIVDIFSCIIHNNIVEGYGGGMYINRDSDVFLSNTTIKENQSYDYGGGILILSPNNCKLEFDTVNRCNIYLNYAAVGTDIYKFGADDTIHVCVDTFTVSNPDYYYLFNDKGYGYQGNAITYSINTGKIEQVDQDLFVSPEGDNANSGLTPDEPLKNLYFALLKIASDSISPDTIHIANGTYSPSSAEKFPLSIKAHANLKGNQRDSCILDGENHNYIMQGIVRANRYEISNLTLKNANHNLHNNMSTGTGAAIMIRNNNASISNILADTNIGEACSGITISSSNNFTLHDVEFRNNIGGDALRVGSYQNDTLKAYNCSFIANQPDYSIPQTALGGSCLLIGDFEFADLVAYFYNCLFAKNHTKAGAGSIRMLNSVLTYAINCTFADNTADYNTNGGNIGLYEGGVYLYIYNSILYNTTRSEVVMHNLGDENYLSIYNSLVLEGEEGIIQASLGNIVYYDPSNIDANPMFDTTTMYPYSLSAGSPCIDAGTLDLPPGIELPETDLAGNPRVYNGYVDMGAYEYGPWVGIENFNPTPKTQHPKLLRAFPNPFRFETTVSYISPEKGHTCIKIYNIRGKHVKTMLDVQGLPGSGTMKWNGKDQNGNVLKAGTYIICLIINGKERDALKVVKR
ncbi:MAG: DUF1565 domain-containing protein [Bacteroidales bacterium]|nr:DUF1565 domain-containing protein [Bacteroidales bacterium]